MTLLEYASLEIGNLEIGLRRLGGAKRTGAKGITTLTSSYKEGPNEEIADAPHHPTLHLRPVCHLLGCSLND